MNQNSKIFHPAPYLEKQILPVLKDNDLSKEVVWTYIVARKYQDNLAELVKKICGVEEPLPKDAKIWLEAYLYPTRQKKEELKCWRSRADLSVGYLQLVENRDSQIRSNGKWINIVEAKWYDDIHPNTKYPEILQLSQLIEHALLMHDQAGNFPERVYVTLLTPQYFKDKTEQFSDRAYQEKFEKYKQSSSLLKNDLKLCPLPFLHHNLDVLLGRIDSLILRWVTYEELLGLPKLLSPKVPGKYQNNFLTWQQVFKKIGMSGVYDEITAGK